MRPLYQRQLSDSIRHTAEMDEQNTLENDLNPRNLLQIDQALRDRRHQGPQQQAVLNEERKRLEQVQAEQMKKAAQDQFRMRLYMRLNPRIGTPQDTELPAQQDPEFMARLMMQMRGAPRAP